MENTLETKEHPVYSKYGADAGGRMYRLKDKKVIKAKRNSSSLNLYIGNTRASRFIYECFNGLIEGGTVIEHIDNDYKNLKLENLRCVDNKEKYKNKIKKIEGKNLSTGEIRYFCSNIEAARTLNILPLGISNVLNKKQKKTKSKIDNNFYFFKRI